MVQYASWPSSRFWGCARLAMLAVFCLLLVLGCGTPAGVATSGPTAVASPGAASPSEPAADGAVVASGGSALLVPERLSSFELVGWRQTGRIPTVVDVRAKWLCEQDRIPGALCIPLRDLEARLSEVPRDGETVVYGSGYGDGDTAEVRAGAQLLLKKGFLKVYELQDGLAGYAVATAPSCGCKP